MIIADVISWVMIIVGSFFLVVGAIGLIRMPDIFTRMHALSVSETMGVGFLLGGMMVQAGFTLVAFKLICLFVLLFFTSPIASHAISRAAMADGVEPVLDGPEIDARSDKHDMPLEDRRKTTTAIDADEAELSASVLVEDEEIEKGEK